MTPPVRRQLQAQFPPKTKTNYFMYVTFANPIVFTNYLVIVCIYSWDIT